MSGVSPSKQIGVPSRAEHDTHMYMSTTYKYWHSIYIQKYLQNGVYYATLL